ncbi:MAG: glycoside hydrolase family 15 protein, partial [Actinobacteria bacterium]|nr:glycoside hydrolase family 15 protein [Actinomycetota bacterium]
MDDRSVAIGDYGLVGDTRTAALVDGHGSVDWMCLPHFDGDPVFAKLLAGDGGGHFAIAPVGDARLVGRRYQPGTSVLETEWQVGGARVVATDGMVADIGGALFPTLCLVRRIEVHGRPARIAVSFDPRFGEKRRRPRTGRGTATLVCDNGGTALALSLDPPVPVVVGERAEVDVEPGRPLVAVLTAVHRGPLTFIAPHEAWRALVADAARWREWTAGIDYDGPHRDEVARSLITLRLLTYSPSGAPVAAPTTSLPESLGGSRNWDYRYAWPRDAGLGIGAFLGVGHVEQACAFLYWLLHASRLDRPRLRALLTIHGKPVPREREVDWEGFAASRPVRFGNGARDQHQLDNYGWVLDAMWLLVRAGHRLYGETWRAGSALADEVVRRWRDPDAGIWEVRDAPRHHVHSKLMAWLALDRALHIAETHPVSAPRRERWRRQRDAIRADVFANGFDERRNTFVRAYGSDDLDAALLVLPILGIEPTGSRRVRGTVEAVRRELSAGGPLLHRYRAADGL